MQLLQLAAKTMTLFALISTSFPMYANEDYRSQSKLTSILQQESRTAADKVLDKQRQPEQVLSFFNVTPDMHVLEVFPGPGYYTEILSDLVGTRGKITGYTHSNWYWYSKSQYEKRLARKPLKNNALIISDINQLVLPKNEYDLATIILGLHDLYLPSEKSIDGSPIKPQRFYRTLFAALKPGATLGIVEHKATENSLAIESANLHRLDPEFVKRELSVAGFKFVASSDVLHNPNDNFQLNVFDATTRRKTDRAVMTFIKPE